ncbi:MAG: hypothetical protein KKC66_04185 [Candidatus Omnitrophica bacterium]|nr:hypothetical protein [Candidatus Omnitrophota bacterium]MBU1933079.1 hypothetical protein [Candidatus Omnitrophota bacterium]
MIDKNLKPGFLNKSFLLPNDIRYTTYDIRNMRYAKRGSVLIMTFIIMATLISITLGFLFMMSIQLKGSGYDVASSKALWLAEAGLQKVIYQIKNSSSFRDNPTTITGNLENGGYSVSVSKNGITYSLSSTGTESDISRTVELDAVVSSNGGSYPDGAPEAFNYAMHSFGNHIKFKDSEGTINGNVASANSVQNSGDPTINGIVTSNSTVPTPFTVNMAGYQSIADNVESSNYTFTEGNTYGSSGSEQIWYVQGNVTIEENVAIYGTVVAEHNVTLGSEDITIDAASGYPALIAGNNISGDGLENSAINGLIAAENNIDFDNIKDATINGAILAGNNITMRDGEDFTVNYDSDITSNPPPYFSGYGGTTTVTTQGWNEIT